MAGGKEGRAAPRPERLFVAHPKAEGGEWGRAARRRRLSAPGPGQPAAPALAGRRGLGHWRLGAGYHGDSRCQGREPIGASPGRFKNLKQKQQQKTATAAGEGGQERGWREPRALRAAQSRGGGGLAGQPYKNLHTLGVEKPNTGKTRQAGELTCGPWAPWGRWAWPPSSPSCPRQPPPS